MYYSEETLPSVGIFWYDTEAHDLFGVYKKNITPTIIERAANNGLPFIHFSSLHHQVWQKQRLHAITHNEPSKFRGKFNQMPRGRVSWVVNQFEVLVGFWAQDLEDELTPLIRTHFGLTKFVFRYDEHFDPGHGWEEE